MFTGIIEEVGVLERVERTGDSARLTVRGPRVLADAGRGDSIAVGGVCLTVVEHDGERFTADVMAETLAVSTLGAAREGAETNLERAARLGDRLGGHLVQGHVDGTARVLSVADGGGWRVLRFALAARLAPLVAGKGSVAIDGVSLTVSAVGAGADGDWFEVSLIPETLAATTLGVLAVGDEVNLETDMLARQVRRLVAYARTENGS